MNPDNACILRLTAAAGTKLADAYSNDTISLLHVKGFSLVQKQFTTHSAFFLHAAWLDQPCGHCPIFLTAASRRSLVRVSVPVWGFNLSVPLLIVVLVSRYLTNKLISRMFIHHRRSFQKNKMPCLLLWSINPDFSGLSSSDGQITYVLRTRAPVVSKYCYSCYPSTCMY
jgi:hypothetical protein